MPYTLHLVPTAQTARIRMTGRVDGAEILAAYHEAVTHPGWKHGYSTLWDTRELTALDFLPEHLATFSAEARPLSALRGPGRSAIVTTDVAVHINAHLLAIKSGGRAERKVRIFGDLSEAEAWLAKGASRLGMEHPRLPDAGASEPARFEPLPEAHTASRTAA